jgi:hypothetical protein
MEQYNSFFWWKRLQQTDFRLTSRIRNPYLCLDRLLIPADRTRVKQYSLTPFIRNRNMRTVAGIRALRKSKPPSTGGARPLENYPVPRFRMKYALPSRGTILNRAEQTRHPGLRAENE